MAVAEAAVAVAVAAEEEPLLPFPLRPAQGLEEGGAGAAASFPPLWGAPARPAAPRGSVAIRAAKSFGPQKRGKGSTREAPGQRCEAAWRARIVDCAFFGPKGERILIPKEMQRAG